MNRQTSWKVVAREGTSNNLDNAHNRMQNPKIKKSLLVVWSKQGTCWPPLWSSGQSSWLQIQRSWVRFPALPNFLKSSGSGRWSTQPREELLGRNSSGSGLENWEYGRRNPSHWPRGIRYPQKLALTSQKCGDLSSVCIVLSPAQATEFSLVLV
jgi:hypothetical protein